MSLSSVEEFANLEAAVNAIKSDVRTLRIANAVTVTSDLIVPQNITLAFELDGQINVASGVTLTISGHLCAPPRLIFGVTSTGQVVFGSGLVPRVYPQWWGALSDGSHPNETTAAVRAAIGSVFTKDFQPAASGDFLGSSQVVEFLAGYYVINDEIQVGSYANIITGSQAIIQQTDNTKNILLFSDAYTVRVSGLRFIGGAIQIVLSNANIDTSVFQIDHCEFQVATQYAIAATPTILTLTQVIVSGSDAVYSYSSFIGAPPIVNMGLTFAGFSNAGNDVTATVTAVDPAIQTVTVARTTQVNETHAGTASDADHISALLTIDNCKFYLPAAVLQTYCDWTNFNSSWVTVGVPLTPPNTAVFSNMHGALHINNMVGVPGFGATTNGCRWIDNYGDIFVDNTRFGGEDFGGVPIIYNYAGPAAASPFLGASVEIRNSWVYCHTEDPNAAVLNLQTNLPQVFIYEGNVGPAHNPLILNGGGIDLDTILKSFSDNQFRYVAEPNEANLLPPAVPEELRPLFNFLDQEKFVASAPASGVWKPGQRLGNVAPSLFGPTGFVFCELPGGTTQWANYGKSSPFPIGPQQAQKFLPGNIAKYSFTMPPTTSAFVAIVTFSADPNFMGSAHYRTVASFLISLTAGFDGTGPVDVLSNAPLFQPATPGVNSTSLGDLYFGTGDSGKNLRPSTSGGSFTVLWTNVSRIDEAYVTIEILHLF